MEKEQNWYAAPQAAVADVGGLSASDLEARKASRGQRLAAAILDGVIVGVGTILAVIGGSAASRGDGGVVAIAVGALLILGVFVVNCVLLHQNGQTIGKRVLGLKIVRTNGDRIGLGRIIGMRIIPISLLGAIPYLGGLISLTDSLMIFGNERRCLHDLIADTIVITE
ncbi:RDD family protein [Dyella sp. BiH032]|uniref:RDD family protein n=1 Tax=Dyella sp. BiH032 TaxID=3075430 RepID=UPI0028936DBD|nr:RDD family protein [Dyella sp. BiH032]WNL47109.1 RDD family protein [Dyella sp. BiH032]